MCGGQGWQSGLRPLGNRLGFSLRVRVAGGTMRLSGWAEKMGGVVVEEAHLYMEVRKNSNGVGVQEEICKGPGREI